MHPGKQLFFGAILAASLVGCASVSAPRTSRPGPAAGEALFFALSTLDIDYRFGGSARESGFDCSGLVQYVFRSAYGIELPRLAVEQSRVGQGIERQRLDRERAALAEAEKQYEVLESEFRRARLGELTEWEARAAALSQEVLKAVMKMSPARVVYVSCDPATLARDAQYLSTGGYHLKRAVPLDMFPQTAHIESVSLFAK